ncbi:MAG: ABC transporter permease subunit [Thomasclavelia sp.]|nr:ABC transporter permease subunit [Thomasclavelia sp.]
MKRIISFGILIIVWEIIGIIIGNSFILPLPLDVLEAMYNLIIDKTFVLSISLTIIRALITVLVSIIFGIGLGLLSYLKKSLSGYISPIMTFIQTIPQISYIIILLFILPPKFSIIAIVFLLVMPIFYFSSLNGLNNIDSELLDIIALYHQPLLFNIFKIYLPLIKGYISSSIETSIPLSFKATVMSEIFVSSTIGIGKQLYLARINIDITIVFAITLWMVIITQLLSIIFMHIKRHIL